MVVHGAAGKMGRTILDGLAREANIEVVGAVDINAPCDFINLPDDLGQIPFSSDLERILHVSNPGVLVDFSTARAVLPMVRSATSHRVNLVIGTTGLSAGELGEIDELAKKQGVGAVVASNFAIGAVVMMHLAAQAARYFDYAEIIEEHHQQKLDAPSGTALTTARMMAKARGKPFVVPEQKEASQPSRGQKLEGITIHSIRLPGIVARQEVILGGTGQTLSIKHDAISRDCYLPGVIIAVKRVGQHQGLVFGLDKLLGL